MRFLAFVAAITPVILRDLVGVVGAAAFTYGAWLIAEAAGFMVGGSFLIAIAALLARRAA